MGKGKTGHGTGSASSGGTSSGGTSSGGTSSGGSSSGSSSGGSSNSGGASSGGSGSSSGSGGGGTGGTKSGQAGARAHHTAGSSSTTTPANNQSTVAVSTPNYSAALGYSTNNLTQGAGSVSQIHSPQVRQSQNTTGQANVVTLGNQPLAGDNAGQVSWNPAQSFETASGTGNLLYGRKVNGQLSQIDPNSAEGRQIASILAEQRARNSVATNTDNQYLQNENAAITNAEKRQQEFVNNNSFMANPQPQATAPIPNVITVSTPLYRQAGEKENPLTILEGNKFISPAQQFLPQENEQFAPRPEYGAFTNNPYIGVHQNSAIQPNADLSESQRKSPMDWLTDIKNHKYFPLAIVGIVVLVALSMFGGAKIKKASGGSKGVFRSTGGSGQPIITVVK